MALTPTTSIPLGFKAPEFALPDVISSKILDFKAVKGAKGTLVIFICNHCPYVTHIITELVELAEEYQQKGFGFVAINSNDAIKYPQDSAENMMEFAKTNQFSFPYLYDESQAIAKSYDAACTPDFNVFDSNDICVYRGEFDAARPGNSVPVNGESLKTVLELLLADREVPQEGQKPSIGCNIKWK